MPRVENKSNVCIDFFIKMPATTLKLFANGLERTR